VGGSSDRDWVDFGSEEEGGAAGKENERQRVFLLACELRLVSRLGRCPNSCSRCLLLVLI
jgi:hypothetical protein